MKLEDLINALADEIESVKQQLDEHLQLLESQDAGSAAFVDALELYGNQIGLMGEAAGMAGFLGLQSAVEHLQKNTLLLAEQKPEERGPVIKFLGEWPDLMVHYLHHLDDASVAAGLVDVLRDAPLPMDRKESLNVMHQLGAMPAGMGGAGVDQVEARPVLAAVDDVDLSIPADVDPKLMDSFMQEAPGQVGGLVTLMNKIVTADTVDLSDLESAKRTVHTLKGSGAIIGINGLANLGHHFEDILEYFEKSEESVPDPVGNILMDAVYCFEQMVGFIEGQDDYPDQSLSVLQDVLDLANRIDRDEDLEMAIRRGGGGQAQDAPVTAAINQVAVTKKPVSSALRINLDRIEELFRVSAEISVQTSAMEARIKQLRDSSKDLLSQNLRVKKRLYELETVVDVKTISMMRSMGQDAAEADFDPLEMEQYSELHSTAHAMIEDANDAIVMSQYLGDEIGQLTTLQTQQQVLSGDLQHLVIGTRMTEVGSLESRLQRNVRTTTQATGKQAVLELVGKNTLIDSDVLNQLSQPLLHLLRNAVDHGLESPDARAESGKDPVGRITLDFSKQGQQVVLRCQDDGGGLNYHNIYQRALDRGIIEADDDLTEEQIGNLIFKSGFSTRESVSQISGRGVGLDVVRDWISSMNGDINVSSQSGQGTTIELRFAASLSTTQTLIVEAAGQSFAIPSLQVQQALASEVGQFVVDGNGGLQYHLEDKIIAAKYLADLVNLSRDLDKPLQDYCAVIVYVQNEIYALAVDTLVDARELLVKDPDRYSRHLPEVAGVSILGDGSVTAHLDISQLVTRDSGADQPTRVRSSARRTEAKEHRKKVLVVDDSLSVRNVLQELVEDLGHFAKTAKDGIDAIDALNNFTPDLVLTDLEMPNMNGVELTEHIRGRDDVGKLPIIMITSRSQTKHKELAVRAGVDEYVTKPYNEEKLLQMIQQQLHS